MKNEDYMLFPATDLPDRNPWLAMACFMGTCLLSICLYVLVFTNVKLPYSVGIYERMLNVKRAHFQQGEPPRLLIIAGSNARVSHRASVFEDELGIHATNGGLSAAVSTAFALESYMPVLKRGDICYLPLEYEPLLLSKRSQHLDGKFALAYEPAMLRGFSLSDQFSAVFSYELNHIFASIAEHVIVRQMGATSDREEIDERGDQAYYDDALAERFRNAIAVMDGPDIPGPEILKNPPEMVLQLHHFLDWCSQHGILAIGGLPTTFEDVPIDPELVVGLRELYESRGHAFIALPNLSRYPREMFYDSKYHLDESAASMHSRAIAAAIQPIIQIHRERNDR